MYRLGSWSVWLPQTQTKFICSTCIYRFYRACDGSFRGSACMCIAPCVLYMSMQATRGWSRCKPSHGIRIQSTWPKGDQSDRCPGNPWHLALEKKNFLRCLFATWQTISYSVCMFSLLCQQDVYTVNNQNHSMLGLWRTANSKVCWIL